MKKRLISLLLVFCMLISLMSTSAIALDINKMSNQEKLELLTNPFTDVAEDAWYYDAVQYVRINGIFNGTSTTTFDPDGTMTRGMFVTVLGRMAGVDAESYKGQSAFTDVPSDAYYAPYVAWASKYGITEGTGDGTFSPDALINRAQMATFFVRYFEAFGVDYETGANITTTPADMDSIPAYAKDAALKLWKQGLLNGDGTNFNPGSNASRAQAATLCMRTDEAVKVWYKEPGVPSDRIRIDPKDVKISDPDYIGSVFFFDDENQCFDIISTWLGSSLSELPSVEKSSRAGKVLLGYYLDPEYTRPFYAENPVYRNMPVYAKYMDIEDNTVLNLTTFTQMDQSPNLTFTIEKGEDGSNVSARNAAELIVKDGSAMVDLSITGNGDGTYTVRAVGGFNEGCTYELALAEGWVFSGKADTIRTASFSIAMAEVGNLRMNENIVYLEDQTGDIIDILSAYMNGESTYNDFAYTGSTVLAENDILCVYMGVHPEQRVELANDDDPDNDGALTDPALYVKVTAVDDGTVAFAPLDENDQLKLYDIPDVFPFYVDTLPAGDGKVNVNDLDISFYETAYGKEEGTLENAVTKVNEGDFVAFYNDLTEGEDSEIFYGRVISYANGIITYKASSEEELLNCMDLYSVVDLGGQTLVSDAQASRLEAQLYAQVEESGFAEEAAFLLAELITETDNFRDDITIQDILLTDGEGNALSDEEIQLLNIGSSFELTDDVKLTVELITNGEQLHFNDGVQLAIRVDAAFEVEAEEGRVAIDLSATFVEEVELKPSIKGELTYTKFLIPIPNGVQVNANVDIKNYTALSFAAEIYTVAEEDQDLWDQMQAVIRDPAKLASLPGVPTEIAEGLETAGDVLDKIDELQNAIDRGTMTAAQIREYTADINALWSVVENTGLTTREDWEAMGETLGKTSITSDLLGLMDLSAETGLSTDYFDSMEVLMQKYSDMINKETDWIKLVEQEIFTAEVCIVGICIGVETNFVVRADMSIALGSNLEYEVGKRYSFWFNIGLYTPTAGSATTDLIDEHFAFQFYVMGRLGVKAGVSAKLYVGIGTGKLASVGIRAELGPYIKLWGFFVYDYSKYRPAGSTNWIYNEQMMGALFMEFGLYFMLSFEAEALGLFEYSHDFLDEEVPLLHAGTRRYYYNMNYDPESDEVVIVRDENGDSTDGITMALPDEVRALSFVDLDTGFMGSEWLDYSRYNFSLTNPNFSMTEDGKISVNVPENTRYMECDLVITYLHGKMAFSTYDMSVTIPLVWTNLGMDELKEYYTASVRVGNDADGYDTVWTKKVLKGQLFDLPTEREIKELMGWSDVKYTMDSGYGSQDLTDLTLIDNRSFDFKINYPTYSITVTGIQMANGGTTTKTFTAKYGQTFDFSELKDTGWNNANYGYSKFANVTTNATIMVNGQPQIIDLTQPINAKMAEALKKGVTATANYIDDSVTAVFTFVGITEEDVKVTLRKGNTPSISAVAAVINKRDAEGNLVYDNTVAISEITPKLGPIDQSTNYMVTCVELSGERNNVYFDMQDGTPQIEPMDKLVGSLLVNLPDENVVSRIGYDFDGWYTEPKAKNELFGQTGENALTQTVPAQQYTTPAPAPEVGEGDGESDDTAGEGTAAEPQPVNYTIYAQWTPKTYTVNFHLNGGTKLLMRDNAADTTIDPKNDKTAPAQMTVVYDGTFGTAYEYTEGSKNLKDLAGADPYGALPTAYRDDSCTFAGWYIGVEVNGTTLDFTNATLVTDDTPVELLADATLYARWKSLVEIPKNIYGVVGYTVTYDGNGYAPTITYNSSITGTYYYLDAPGTKYEVAYPTTGYTIDFMRETSEQYVRRSQNPHVAGTYFTRIEREADETYAKMSYTYTAAGEVLKITKASSSLSGTLSVETHGRAVIPTLDITSQTGDGTIEYKVGSNGTWSNTGVIYDLSPGTYTVYARLGEGMNYNASTDYVTTTVNVTASNTFHYKLVVHTADEGNAGTDSDIYAKIGDGSFVHLDKDDYNDFERDDTDSYSVSVPDSLSINGNVNVTIKFEEKGIASGWKLGWLRVDVYENNTKLQESDQCNVYAWFEDGTVTRTYTVTGSHLGRNVDTSSYGLKYDGSYITIDDTTISDNYKSNYDPYYYPNAPKLVAYFSNSIFNKYITRNSFTEFYVDWAGVRNAMDEYRITSLTLNYGIDYGITGGVYGAADYMQSYTYSIDHLDYID